MHVSFCHTSNTLVVRAHLDSMYILWCTWIWGSSGKYIFIAIKSGSSRDLFYMDCAMAEIISDVFQSHLVENILVPNHLHGTSVL